MECRSLCLDDNYDLVARSFPRFFNLHEALDINDKFNWKSFEVFEKLDGWFCKIFNYKGEWIFSSRSGFGDNPTNDPNISFGELVGQIMGPNQLAYLNEKVCHTFELVGPYTKIVKNYSDVNLVALTSHFGDLELDNLYTSVTVKTINHPKIRLPQRWKCDTADQVFDLVSSIEKEDKTWEGVVLQDSNGLRIKLKSPSYVNLHHLRGEGNLFLPKYLIPIILDDDYDEILEYWPEVRDNLLLVKDRLDLHSQRLTDLWEKVKNIESQKEFALSIVNETPFTAVLFQARKQRRHPKEVWVESADLINKVLY